MFYFTLCDKLFGSERALNDRIRKKNDTQNNSNAKLFRCGECDASLTISSNLLRYIRKQHNSDISVRSFFCPTYFGNGAALVDHNEVFPGETKPHWNIIDVSTLLEFTTKAKISKFFIHHVKLKSDGALEPFIYLVSHNDRVIGFVNNLLKETLNGKLRITSTLKLEKPFESEVTEAFLK